MATADFHAASPPGQPGQGLPPLHISRTRRATFFTLVGLGTVVGTWLMVVYLAEGGLGAVELALLAPCIPL